MIHVARKDRQWAIRVIERLLHKLTNRDLELMYTFAISLLRYEDRHKADGQAVSEKEAL